MLVAPEWRINASIQLQLDAMTDAEREHIPGAKSLALEMGETCPDAWVWYIGWAASQYLREQQDTPGASRAELLARVAGRGKP